MKITGALILYFCVSVLKLNALMFINKYFVSSESFKSKSNVLVWHFHIQAVTKCLKR